MPQENIDEIKDQIKKLSPSQKLKRLKELKNKRKTEIEEIGFLIEDSEKEIKTNQVAEDIIPRANDIDITRLFEEDSTLLEREFNKTIIEHGNMAHDYNTLTRVYNDYSKLQDIAYASMIGSLTPNLLTTVDQIGERLDKTKYQSAGHEIANILVASRAAIHKIRKYAGTEGNQNF
jgi:hypothetical protein